MRVLRAAMVQATSLTSEVEIIVQRLQLADVKQRDCLANFMACCKDFDDSMLEEGLNSMDYQSAPIAATREPLEYKDQGARQQLGTVLVAKFLHHVKLDRSTVISPDNTRSSERQLASSPESRRRTDDAVTLSTIHGAKGLEWRTVFGVQLNSGVFPAREDSSPIYVDVCKSTMDAVAASRAHLEDERRLWYVLMSRAKDALWFLYSTPASNTHVRRGDDKPSLFLQEMWARSETVFLAPLTSIYREPRKLNILQPSPEVRKRADRQILHSTANGTGDVKCNSNRYCYANYRACSSNVEYWREAASSIGAHKPGPPAECASSKPGH